jgi:hypothetical protein
VKHGILAEEDLIGGSFSPMAVQVQSRQFFLLAVPDFNQFVPGPPESAAPRSIGDLILVKLGGIVQALPYTPYTGVGINHRSDSYHTIQSAAPRGSRPGLRHKRRRRDGVHRAHQGRRGGDP